MNWRRYQLRKEAVGVALRHPWIFRDHLSSAASVFRDGERLRLFDGHNRIVGYGLYEATGAIAIRMLRRGDAAPDAAWLRGQLAAAVNRRSQLATHTDAIRLVHGESDGLPALVVDRFADTLVVSSYAAGSDGLARFAARALATGATGREIIGPAHHVVLRPARLRQATTEAARTVRGTPPGLVTIHEHGLALAVDLEAGQKTGTYLDLRGLRREVAAASLTGARVLNLFAYSGMLGRAAEAAGATTIVQVDASARALELARAHHVVDLARHQLIVADVFDWLPSYAPDAPFDLVIVDPPSMTSKATQVPGVLAAYRKLYRAAAQLVRPGGRLVAACCTSRIERAVFHKTVGDALGADFSRDREIPPEPDHPVSFPQADYLKIAWWNRAG
ncbi:MAG TPA: class I SAM-dependent methyltransferase [Kofleriaceae bacterium]|nr:class I SAM-dependent methyltransferase [Kofleriaceae bacterium]